MSEETQAEAAEAQPAPAEEKFVVVDGKFNMTVARYNELNAEHGSPFYWCPRYGFFLKDAEQRDDRTVDVYVREGPPDGR